MKVFVICAVIGCALVALAKGLDRAGYEKGAECCFVLGIGCLGLSIGSVIE